MSGKNNLIETFKVIHFNKNLKDTLNAKALKYLL